MTEYRAGEYGGNAVLRLYMTTDTPTPTVTASLGDDKVPVGPTDRFLLAEGERITLKAQGLVKILELMLWGEYPGDGEITTKDPAAATIVDFTNKLAGYTDSLMADPDPRTGRLLPDVQVTFNSPYEIVLKHLPKSGSDEPHAHFRFSVKLAATDSLGHPTDVTAVWDPDVHDIKG